MTLVTSRRELKPSEARNLVARQATPGNASSPRLARGRAEKLVRSRSPTPPGHGKTAWPERDDKHGHSRDPEPTQEPASPLNGISAYTAATATATGAAATMSQVASFQPPMSDTSWGSPTTTSSRSWRKRSLSESQYSELTDITEEQSVEARREQVTSAAQLRTYPIRIADIIQSDHYHHYHQHHNAHEAEHASPTASSVATPSSIPSSSAKSDVTTGRRPQPLAPRPAGYPRVIEAAAVREDGVGYTKKTKGKGIKTPYKNQEEKDKVKAVRDSGACMRCVIFRQACEVLNHGQTCRACQVVSRKWHIPCTKIWLRDRCWSLLPAMFFDHLQLSNGTAFPIYPDANRSHNFPLRLSKHFGLEFQIQVFAVVGIQDDRNLFTKLTFTPKEGGLGAALDEFAELSLPLVPLLTSTAVETVEIAVRDYMHKYSRRPTALGLPEVLFPGQEGQKWVKEVFDIVCGFQESILQGQSSALNLALKTIFIRCLISRTFDIPADHIREVNDQLPVECQIHPEAVEALASGQLRLCPKFADRFVKAALLKSLKTALLPRCFSELEDLFHLMEKDHGKSKLSSLSRDEVFCTIIVILLLAGICQVKIMHAAIGRLFYNWENVNDKPGGRESLYQEAFKSIYAIERDVIDHILHLWVYQFKREKMVGHILPHEERAAFAAANYNPIGLFQDSVIAHGDSLSRIQRELKLEQSKIDSFVDENLSRILLRLNDVLYRPSTRQR